MSLQFNSTQFFLADAAAKFFRLVEDIEHALHGTSETRFSLDTALTHLEAAREQAAQVASPERGILVRVIDLWHAMITSERVKFVGIENPYIVGRPLDPLRSPFFGRQDVFKWISDNLTSTKQKNILVIHGERRVGKTSILLQVQRGKMGKFLRQHEQHPICPILIDLHGFNDTGTHKFLYYICSSVYRQVHEYSPAITVTPPDLDAFERVASGSFQDYIKNICRLLGNTLLVLMIDEFEWLDELLKLNKVEKNIYIQLRSLMQFETNLTFILAGTHELEELSSEYRNLVHNIAVICEISFMDERDAADLIRQPVAGLVSYENNAVEELYRYTHGHPWLLQSLCYLLIEDMNRRGEGNFIALGHVAKTIRRFISERELDSLWERCNRVDKSILLSLAHSDEGSGPGMTQLQLAAILNQYSEEEISGSLARLVKRTLLEKSASSSGEVRYAHTIPLFSQWLALHTGSMEMAHQ